MTAATPTTTTDDTPVEQRIRDYLAEQLDADDLRLHNIQRIAVGWSHETWLFDATWTQQGVARGMGFCLRRDPGNALLRELSDLGAQHRVLEALDSTAVPTPHPYFFEDVPNILGAPFLVMEKVAGTCPSPWGREGRRFYAEAAARGTLPASFTDTLVALHTLDWRAAGLGDVLPVPGPGPDFVRQEIAKWRRLIDDSGLGPDPILVDVIGWLEANAPDTEHFVLVHGAYRTGNLLIHDDKVSAVLDWETEVIGDPMYDVAYVLSELNREGTDLLSNLVEHDEFVRRYEAGTGFTIDRDRCRYYHVLYAMRSAAFWMSATGLFADGRNTDLRLARTQWSIPVVLDQAAKALGY
jgi:aminoglycoside phosphotransferase (APT) family kinase protein